MGLSGAGKTTQAKILEQNSGFARFCAGDKYRELAETHPKLKALMKYDPMLEGKPAEPYREMLYKWLDVFIGENYSRHIILDGTPRSASYAQRVDEFLEGKGLPLRAAFIFSVGESEVRQRLVGRGRGDDTSKEIECRIARAQENMQGLVDHYAGRSCVFFDAAQSEDVISAMINREMSGLGLLNIKGDFTLDHE